MLDRFIAEVGRERYDRACEWAWRTGPRTGRMDQARDWPDGLDMIPHDLSDLWFEPGAGFASRLDAAIQLYREMPCYANTMYVKGFHGEFTRAQQERFWSFYREMLSAEEDALADPIAYSLWVDYFEDASAVDTAWREVTRRDVVPWERRIARVLDHAGPVPWALKEALFADLVTDRAWHRHIFEAIKGGVADVYGQSDPTAARSWLQRLRLPPDTPDLAQLREELQRKR